MSTEEAQCFLAAREWQRRSLNRELKQSLIPSLPYYKRVKNTGVRNILIYALIITLLAPILLIVFFIDAIIAIGFFPFRRFATFKIPESLKAPGEGNIQGIHNAFIAHFDLPPDYYVNCVNEWAKILYAKRTKDLKRMQDFLDFKQLNQIHHFDKPNSEITSQLRVAINYAREQLSQSLGSYR